MIKSLLKKVVPRPWLKKAFLLANKIKIETIDKIVFPALPIARDEFTTFREVNPFLLLSIDQSAFSQEVRHRLQIWTDPAWTQDEYLLQFDGAGYIEPKIGWGITTNRKLIYPSLGFSKAPYVHKPDLFEMFIRRKNTIALKAIISLRDTGEENYFHFFNDVIPKLYFIRDAGLDLKAFTVVVSKKLYDKNYFKIIVESSWLKNLTFHVQDQEWIEFRKAVFCKPLTHTLKYFRQTIDFVVPKTIVGGKRRIFITRDSKTLRFIENMQELLPALNSYGFEIIDSATLNFSEQVLLFSQCDVLIGVHGAGLTNMIFRYGHPLNVVEIAHPFQYIPFHYIMLARQFDYLYTVLLGKESKSVNGGFRVEPNELEDVLKKIFMAPNTKGSYISSN